jgi:hypothetical protein
MSNPSPLDLGTRVVGEDVVPSLSSGLSQPKRRRGSATRFLRLASTGSNVDLDGFGVQLLAAVLEGDFNGRLHGEAGQRIGQIGQVDRSLHVNYIVQSYLLANGCRRVTSGAIRPSLAATA